MENAKAPSIPPSLLLSVQDFLHNTYTHPHPLLTQLTRFYVLIPLLLATYIFYQRFLSNVSHIPGPFSASISNWWKISAAWNEEMPKRNIAAHRQYGPLVRIGPNMISVDDPAALSTIYGFKPIYLKVCVLTSLIIVGAKISRLPSIPSSKLSTMANFSPTSSPLAPSSTMRISNVPLLPLIPWPLLPISSRMCSL